MSRSLFLTGASGFVGSSLLARLSEDSARRIICLGRRKPTVSPARNVEFLEGDLLNRASYAAALQGCDTVLNLAAATGKKSPAEYFRVNRDGTEALAREARCAGVQRFLHVSTIAVKFLDKSRYYYAQSKEQAEAVVAQSGLRWTIVRPTIVLGPNSPVLEALSSLSALPVVPVFGDGRALVQPIFVNDLVECLVAVLDDEQLDGRTLEVGGPEALSIEDLLLRIRRAQGGGKAPIIHLPARPIAALLGWLEPFLRSLLPFTAGQLASYTNAGTAHPDPWVAQFQSRMKNVDEMLGALDNEPAAA
jgi:NADH dehydrogenase